MDSVTLGNTAIWVFRFGEATVGFRHLVEQCVTIDDARIAHSGVTRRPWPVDHAIGLLAECRTHLGKESSLTIGAGLDAVVAEADRIRTDLADELVLDPTSQEITTTNRVGWDQWAHATIETTEAMLSKPLKEVSTLAAGMVTPSRWAAYDAGIETLRNSCPSILRTIFDLSALLAGTQTPMISKPETQPKLLLRRDPAYLQGVISPTLSDLIGEVRIKGGLLRGVPDRLEGADPWRAAQELQGAIRTALATRFQEVQCASEPEGWQRRFRVDRAKKLVWIHDEPHPVSEETAAWIDGLVRAGELWIAFKEIVASEPILLKSTKLERIVEGIPSRVLEFIKRQPAKGARIVVEKLG